MRIACASVVLICSLLPCLAQSPSTPKPRHCSKPKTIVQYPDELRGSGIEGTVVIRAVIDEKGCPHNITVVKKLNPKLDKLAKEQVNSWEFTPATKDGKPVRVLLDLEVNFKDPGK